MAVDAVQKYGNHNYNGSYLPNVVKATAIGAAAGYIGKYAIPLAEIEKVFEDNDLRRAARSKSNELHADKFEKSSNKTPAREAFIKLVKGKDKTRFSNENLEKIAKNLGSEDGINFKNIISEVNQHADDLKSDLKLGYKFIQKHKRPAGIFMGIGASLGFLTGVFYNVFKTDVRA